LFEAESYSEKRIIFAFAFWLFRDMLEHLCLTHIGKYMSLGLGVINPGLIYIL